MELTNAQRDIALIVGVIFAFLQVVVGVVALLGSEADEAQKRERKLQARKFLRATALVSGYMVASSLAIVVLSVDIWMNNNATASWLLSLCIAMQLAIGVMFCFGIYLRIGRPAPIAVLYGGCGMVVLIGMFIAQRYVPTTPSYAWHLVKMYVLWGNAAASIMAFFSFVALTIGCMKRLIDFFEDGFREANAQNTDVGKRTSTQHKGVALVPVSNDSEAAQIQN